MGVEVGEVREGAVAERVEATVDGEEEGGEAEESCGRRHFRWRGGFPARKRRLFPRQGETDSVVGG